MNQKLRLRRQCWARALGDCEGKLSREHVFSDSISTNEFPLYYREKPKIKIKSNSITIKYLCKKHNNELGQYDNEGKRFVEALRYIFLGHNHLDANSGIDGADNTIRINGKKLERWFAKTLFNFSAYKGLIGKLDRPIRDVNSTHILEYLFRKEDVPEQYGLFLLERGTNLLQPGQLQAQVATSEYVYCSISTGMACSYCLPGLLYLQAFGIEFVGNFNITEFDDLTRDKIVIGENFSNFEPLSFAEKRPSALTFYSASLTKNLLGENKNTTIIFEW